MATNPHIKNSVLASLTQYWIVTWALTFIANLGSTPGTITTEGETTTTPNLTREKIVTDEQSLFLIADVQMFPRRGLSQ